ncbi:MAG TPA: hypothetical protein VI876_09210, partial [Dehalococcoidia bacterium]|nr:hypothetical protein [Dehalococcoidia bacterium]
MSLPGPFVEPGPIAPEKPIYQPLPGPTDRFALTILTIIFGVRRTQALDDFQVLFVVFRVLAANFHCRFVESSGPLANYPD